MYISPVEGDEPCGPLVQPYSPGEWEKEKGGEEGEEWIELHNSPARIIQKGREGK